MTRDRVRTVVGVTYIFAVIYILSVLGTYCVKSGSVWVMPLIIGAAFICLTLSDLVADALVPRKNPPPPCPPLDSDR